MPPLNLDVLSTVSEFLTDYDDLLSLSLTSSAYRPLAIRTLLRTRPVLLNTIDTILKFHDFVFTDPPSRMPHIVVLVVDVPHSETHPDPEYSERALEALVMILRGAPCLKSLELLSSANGRPLAYLDDPRLSAAVGEIASLRELRIGGRTEVTDFIGAVSTPLTKLALRFLNPVGGLNEWSPTSLCAALSRFSHSLESLAIEQSKFHALRSLTLNHLVTVPHLPLFFELFPNLDDTVHLAEFIYEDVPDQAYQSDAERYEFFRRAREQNGAAQEGRCWTRLKRLICDVETLFVVNLRCPIGLTMIAECPAHADSLERRYLAESLRAHPPARLNLHITAEWNGGEDDPSLGGMIPREAAATLTHLTLFVQYTFYARRFVAPPSTELRWDDVWRGTLLPAIAHLHALTHFRLVFHCLAQGEAEDPARPISEEPLVEDLRPSSAAAGSRSGFDCGAVAFAIADALPSLRYCFLTNSARVFETKLVYMNTLVEQWCESRAWRIVPDGYNGSGVGHPAASLATPDTEPGAQRELVELQDGVAEGIIEREGLILTEEEKARAIKHTSLRRAMRWVE
uniref:Bifunctional solanapyrone synthase (Prosolanapyrone-II oxidase) (Prosolanapyrone-III cycloisomerase) (Solanapyrone biosynthesis protein 5))) n=1 Tax=Ganoderma boninense TaxID=34458 RepID=A0A5K1K6H9_9APHY|nr:Bifunctional solanapyrone synthase (EC (EC (FAD-dependent monooxygenase sol5) (Prosolanapyrone-II oxidase) (Prosolanapyrone-III cycloisomerase) (Solanapyrone biosynthesis protein 5) [Ganoderma boninense]